jgi:hypothetical protein
MERDTLDRTHRLNMADAPLGLDITLSDTQSLFRSDALHDTSFQIDFKLRCQSTPLLCHGTPPDY